MNGEKLQRQMIVDVGNKEEERTKNEFQIPEWRVVPFTEKQIQGE